MNNLSNISVIKDILQKHGFSFSKSLGQNFLINPTVCPKMAEMCGAGKGVGVIEIGAGIGVLTAELCKISDKVVCIEIDDRLLPILDETLAEFDNLKIINSDVLKVDLHNLIADEFAGLEVVVCANLPYYITSPIVMSILEAQLPIKAITVMVQKEAATRICAEDGSREVGAVSIAVRYYSVPKLLFNVSRGSFMPSPDVDSAVIRLEILKAPPVNVNSSVMFFKVVKGAFSQRRKTILNCISSFFALPKQTVADALNNAGIKQTARAEELKLQQFADIANELEKI